jgi:LPS-assembly protein
MALGSAHAPTLPEIVPKRPLFPATFLCLILAGPASAQPPLAEDSLEAGLDWDYCGLRPARLGPSRLPTPPGEQDPVTIEADDLGYDQINRLLRLEGDIALVQGSRQVRAQEMAYAVETEELTASGDLFLAQPGVRILGTGGQINLKTNQGQIQGPRYRFTGPLNARGKAQTARLLEEGKTSYEDIVYTTCPPGSKDWDLSAARLDIDQQEGRGVARHAKLRVMDVPVLYSPYLSFPIDDRRKSGFLVPSIGNSSRSGFKVVTPYYFNIAPNMDATLTPTFMSRRGLLLGGEFRYLSPRHTLDFYAEGISNDREYEESGVRGALRLLHQGNYGAGWSSSIRFQDVSDKQYLEDFGNRLELTSLRNIERRGDLNYRGQGWRARLTLQDFQNVDISIPPENYPYSRLPQLELDLNPWRSGAGLELGLRTQYNYFDHDRKVHGGRASIQPQVSWPIRRTYGHLIPRLNFWGAAYDLQNTQADNPSDPAYAIPSFNLDGQLIFERQLDWLGQSALQTLEPRIFYLYTPYEDQSDIPLFDTTDLSFSYGTLFLPNRFAGYDRVGDANQVTLGLSSRILQGKTGQQLLRASLGKIIYLEDPRVWLSDVPEERQQASALVGEVSALLMTNLTGRTTLRWDPDPDVEEDALEKLIVELRYQSSEKRLLNLAYRYDVGETEATRYQDLDLSARWPITPQVELVGRYYYSLLNDKVNEGIAGISYGRCCWQLSLLGHHINNQPGSDGETSFMVQLELAGLGKFGQKIDQLLERGIYGYTTE